MKKSVKKVISMFTCIAVVGGMLLMGCGQTSVPDEIADSSEKKESSVEPEKNGEEPALQKVTLNEVAHSIFYAPMYVAIEEGYFKDAGIDLDLVTGFGADKVMTAVLSGRLCMQCQCSTDYFSLRCFRCSSYTSAEKEGAEMIYLQLFLSFLQIGAFSFGGGYAAMPLIQSQVVDSHKWLSMAEFTNLITISQMTPGPIAVNSATFVGLKVAGIGGAAIATAGCILPSCILVTLLAKLYLRYRKMDLLQGILGMLRPAVVALIASAGVSILVTAFWPEGMILIQKTQIDMVIIFIAAVYLIQFRKMNPVLVMVLSGVAKLGIYLVGTFLL